MSEDQRTSSKPQQQQNPQNTPIHSSRTSSNKNQVRLLSAKNSELPSLSKSFHLKTNFQKIKPKSSKLIENQHVKYLYHHFCQQIYGGGVNRTFDHIARSAEFMPVNKWMVFCRQFHIGQKLHKKILLDIHRQVAGEKQDMVFKTFIYGLQLVKEKANISQTFLVNNMLCSESRQSVRQRLKNLKVQFDGPKINYFVESQLFEKEKAQNKKIERKRKLIPHQGMSIQHIQRQLKKRKIQRQEKKSRLINSSLLQNKSLGVRTNNYNEILAKKPFNKRKNNYFQSYNQIFKQKQQEKQRQNIIQSMKKKLAQAQSKRYSVLQRPQKQLQLNFEQTEQSNVNEQTFFQTQILEQNQTKGKISEPEKLEEKEQSEEKEESEKSELAQNKERNIEDLFEQSESDEILKQHFAQEEQKKKKLMQV